jgi:ribonuclease Z
VARLTLLGTGFPRPDPARRGAAQVVEASGDLVLIDCGASATHRFAEAGLDPRRLRRIALTHLHSDHITGIPDLLWGGAVMGWWQRPPAVIGPPGTRDFLERLIDAFHYDLKVRGLARDRVLPEVTEVDEGWTDETDTFRINAFRVEHEPVDQAFGYRIDADGRATVISGDTRRSENLIRRARGADLLVHEVISRPGMEERIARAPDTAARERARTVLSYHTPADELGDIATRAGVRHLLLSHIIDAGRPTDELVDAARRGYSGRLTLGEDLMEVQIG